MWRLCLLGLTSDDIGRQVRDAFYGSLALRQLRGIHEIEVRVKLPELERESLSNLENLVVRTPAGVEVPLIVMVAIPFGIIGGVIGDILLGFDLSLISLMGMIALSGVVVNDSLIMIDFANRNRGQQSAFDAITQAGVRRFRPIILTTLTTFGGLTPIILETSQQAAYLIPMAISLGFGIVFATAIILILVPALYLILDDVAARATEVA